MAYAVCEYLQIFNIMTPYGVLWLKPPLAPDFRMSRTPCGGRILKDRLPRCKRWPFKA